MEGWIKLHRKVIENPIFSNAHLFHLYSYCLLKANHKDREIMFNGELMKIEAGQFITGRNIISEAVGENPNTTYKRLKKLEKMKYLSLKSNNKYTLITVGNWESYQSTEEKVTTKEQPSNNKVTTKEQQSNTNKNEETVKNDIKKIYSDSVKLTNEQYEKMIERFGEVETKDKIENLSLYINSKGDKYKCHYSTILSWDRKDKKNKPNLKVVDKTDKSQYGKSGQYIGWKTGI